MTRVRGLARFWWDFVIGDDWRLALGGAVALATTALLTQAGVSAWWSTPAIVITMLVATVARAQPRSPR
jgi:hypothetical protein